MRILERVASLVAPFDCLNCGSEGVLICEKCWQTHGVGLPSRCYRCRAATDDFAVCERCRKQSRLKQVWVRTQLEGLPKELLYRFKFERAGAAAEIIAGYMAEILPELTNTVIVPVPTASSRARARGYDHARLLAKHLSVITGLPVVSALSRIGQTRQVGTKREMRLRQLKGAYRVTNSRRLNNNNLLLIDDVVTTGASLEAAARVLREAGAKNIKAVVFAQRG